MSILTDPLDKILHVVNDLIQTSHTGRRGSSLDSAFDTIIENVNIAKNNIIAHLLDKKPIQTVNAHDKQHIHSNLSFSNVLQKGPVKNNIIIPLGEPNPSKEMVANVENKIYNLLEKSNSSATIVKTSTTDKGNFVVNFRGEDNIDAIKSDFTEKFGDKIKIVKAIQPKIQIVSIPTQFNTSNKEEILKNISESNEVIKQELSHDKDCLQYLFSYKAKYYKTVVLKCSPKLRTLLRKSGDAIKLCHKLCKIYDRHHVLQCSNCSKYGHSAQNCKEETSICTFCSEDHHFKKCENKDNKSLHKCYNCANSSDYNSQANTHNAFSDTCPIKVIHKNKVISRTNTRSENIT